MCKHDVGDAQIRKQGCKDIGNKLTCICEDFKIFGQVFIFIFVFSRSQSPLSLAMDNCPELSMKDISILTLL